MNNRLKHKAYLTRYILTLLVACSFIACDKQIVYHSFQSIPTEGWKQQDTLHFPVSVTDSQTHYQLYLEIRNRSNYPYQNLPVKIQYTGPDSCEIACDSLNLFLANSQGNWQGKGWGGLYQSSFPVKQITINQAGNYGFNIIYHLPDSLLPGINDVGICLEKLHQPAISTRINTQKDK